MALADLQSIAKEIEEEIKLCENDLKKVGSLVIKAQSFVNLLAKEDSSDQAVRQLKGKAMAYQNKVKELSERRNREREDFEQELTDSKIRTKKITEVHDTGTDAVQLSQKQFFSTQTSKLDDFISTSMDSLESLKQQSLYIDRINDVLKRGASRLGVSNETLNRIESRFWGDKSLFIIFLIGIVVLIFVLRFAS